MWDGENAPAGHWTILALSRDEIILPMSVHRITELDEASFYLKFSSAAMHASPTRNRGS